MKFNKVNKLLEIASKFDLYDIVDIDMYVYKNPKSKLAKLYNSLTKVEFFEFLERLGK